MRGKPVVVLGVATAVFLAGCGGSTQTSSSKPESKAVSTTTADPNAKYTQTWKTPYGETTCAQFQKDMTRQQAWAMAADMLTGARNHDKENSGLPADEMVDEFLAGLVNVCVGDKLNMNMGDVGTGLYLTEPRFHP